jgi:hypothetical protein
METKPLYLESGRKTRKGTRPNPVKKAAVPGSGRNHPAKGFNPVTKL